MVETRIKPQNKFSLGLQELWQYRELFYFFTWRDVKVRYKQATLGVAWAVLQPLSMMLIFTLVFSRHFNLPSDGIPYPVFAYSGLLIWQIFAGGLQNAAKSMLENANIIKKIYFPRLIIPLSAILVALFDFCVALVVFVGLVAFYKVPFSPLKCLLYLPLSIAMVVVTTFGLGIFIAALNVKYRDFQYVVPFLIQFLLFVNPVLYSTQTFGNNALTLVNQFNPIAGSINLIRGIFTEGPILTSELAAQCGVALFLLAVGIYTFRKTEAYFADLA